MNTPRAPLDAVAARRVEEAETARLMQNWAAWREGASISVAVSSAFTLKARGRREAVSMPLMNGEAADVDAAVDALPRELQEVVHVHWLSKLPGAKRAVLGRAAGMEDRARACGCSVATFYRRLGHAHERIRALMRAKRTQAERAREAYRQGVRDGGQSSGKS